MIDTNLIEEGRRLDKREGNLRWEWGDWALKVAPMGALGVKTGAYERLQEAMGEAGIESVAAKTVMGYREVADVWPATVRTGAAWSVHQMLALREDRLDLIRDGMTVREAREITGRRAPEQNIIDAAPVTPERVREAIKADGDLVREIVKDPAVASRLDVALGHQRVQDRREMPIPPRRPTSYSAGIAIQSVLILTMDAKDLLKDAEVLASLSEESKVAARRAIGVVREALDTAEAIMSGEDVQDTIDKILAEAQ
jgi:hypothetical protein